MSARARLQAPRAPGAVLAEPPLAAVGRCLADNRDRLDQTRLSILGRPLPELRQATRQAALAASRDYLRGAGEPAAGIQNESSPPDWLLLSGHQPELFHPGVWVKNFALNGLALAHGGGALNLVVDTDLAKSADLKVPTWEGGQELTRTPPGQVHRQSLPLDRGLHEAPFEEWRVQDEELFASLPERLAPLTRGWPFEPLLADFWSDVRRAAVRTDLLGERLVMARRTWERRWGCQNAEVTVSRLCQTEPFAWFACDLLTRAAEFHALYNARVHDYRRRNGIKSASHPVPDLVTEGDWLELPFWGWRREQTQRGRLLVRPHGESVELRLGKETLPSLPLRPEAMVEAWLRLERDGIKLRSRALTTTLFARVFLGDLFIHGIGGAKYDEITDDLIAGFYGLEPPHYVVVSATLYLPFPSYPARPDDVQRQERRLRELWWNPQYQSPGSADFERLRDQKRRWVELHPADGRARRERFHRLRELTEALRPFVATTMSRVQSELRQEAEQLHANAILQRRDYSFALFPATMLKEYFTPFLAADSRSRGLAGARG